MHCDWQSRVLDAELQNHFYVLDRASRYNEHDDDELYDMCR
jgi:hypothetical protein